MADEKKVYIQNSINLKSYNTFRLPATASQFFNLKHAQELKQLYNQQKKELETAIILGGGSNVLLTDDIDQLVIKNSIPGIRIVSRNKNQILIEIGGGYNWHKLVMYCVERGWGGIENLAMIPGTTGAAPIQNIGAYGIELESVFDSLNAFDIREGVFRTFTGKDCDFDYRTSVFKQELKGAYIIVSLRLRLELNKPPVTEYTSLERELERRGIDQPTIKNVAEAVIKIRKSKLPDPAEIGNAGSFFKNPVISKKDFGSLKKQYPAIPGYELPDGYVKVPAGWLIDQAGWKGKTLNNAAVHHKQALVLVNRGDAKAKDVLELASKIKHDIKIKYNIDLEEEVNILP